MADLGFTENGAEVYFTKPCRRGHAGTRYVSNGECVACHAVLYKTKMMEVRRNLELAIDEMKKIEKELLG